MAEWTVWLALPVLVVALPHLVRLLAELHVILARHLLGRSPAEELAALREKTRELSDRNRLARELHDSVGHTLTVGVLQAAAAERVFDDNPAFVKEALGTIASSHRTALEELDRVLGVMREDLSIGQVPALSAVAALAASARGAGLPVDAVVTGDIDVVPMAVSAEA